MIAYTYPPWKIKINVNSLMVDKIRNIDKSEIGKKFMTNSQIFLIIKLSIQMALNSILKQH